MIIHLNLCIRKKLMYMFMCVYVCIRLYISEYMYACVCVLHKREIPNLSPKETKTPSFTHSHSPSPASPPTTVGIFTPAPCRAAEGKPE